MRSGHLARNLGPVYCIYSKFAAQCSRSGVLGAAAIGRPVPNPLMSAVGREEPDDPLLSCRSTAVAVLHSRTFLSAQGGLFNTSPDGRRGRPLTPSSQKLTFCILHNRAADRLFKRQRQLSPGPYVAIR